MAKLRRKEVYKIIDGECDYSGKKYGNTLSSDRPGSGERTIDEFILYISGYSDEARAACRGTQSGPDKKLDIVRQIAGLCVQCMVQHGAPARIMPKHVAPVKPSPVKTLTVDEAKDFPLSVGELQARVDALNKLIINFKKEKSCKTRCQK